MDRRFNGHEVYLELSKGLDKDKMSHFRAPDPCNETGRNGEDGVGRVSVCAPQQRSDGTAISPMLSASIRVFDTVDTVVLHPGLDPSN
jgi:hypothetical protein